MISADRSNPLLNWIPHKLLIENNQVLCKWLYVSNKRFTEPFFDETIAKCLSYSQNSTPFKSTSDLDFLIEATEEIDSVPPSAFIFHVSRCGSTLLSQLLSIDERNIVLSEVPLLDEILRLQYKTESLSEKKTEEVLSATIKLLAQKRTVNENRLFIKLDSWHIGFYKTIRKLFPDVPFIFLYRSPDEVIRSHQKQRGMHSVPGLIEPQVFGLSSEEINDIDMDAYLSNVLESYFSTILTNLEHEKNILLLNYVEGGMSMLQRIANKLSYNFNEKLLTEMKERSQFHSKRPEVTFAEENEKQPVPPYQKKAMELYHQLEEKRLLQRR
jgi:hypothetical protein